MMLKVKTYLGRTLCINIFQSTEKETLPGSHEKQKEYVKIDQWKEILIKLL